MKTPRNYQTEAARYAQVKNLLLADECGLGKTLTAILAVPENATRVLVVCPLRLRLQWFEEISEQYSGQVTLADYGIPYELYVHKKGWYITYYEAIVKDPSLANYLWDFVILDEAHRIRNRQTTWTKKLKHIPSVRRIALTGTPMEKTPADLWSILNFLHPTTYSSYWRFYNKYVEYTEEGWKRKYRVVLGPKNVDKLSKELQPIMMRRTKKQVEPELPARIEQYVEVPMNAIQQELYDGIANSDDIIYDEGPEEIFIPNVLSLLTKLHQISTDVFLVYDVPPSSEKTAWVEGWLADNPEPVIIFTRYRPYAEWLSGHLKKLGADNELIVGGVKDPPKRFLDGGVRVVVGTIGAMGEGLNLQRAEVAIFVDQVWSATQMSQAIDRIHRIGIDSPRVIYYLGSSPTDELVQEAFQKKWSDADIVFEAVERQVVKVG